MSKIARRNDMPSTASATGAHGADNFFAGSLLAWYDEEGRKDLLGGSTPPLTAYGCRKSCCSKPR
ncbi:hypothetical protein [Methylogaea oryzae]|uniref:hypothetical protein n=1 Tax=Methylogaea oryzae TaxID=1295382 RepID=UPI001C3F4977|nr:hypothetical protein [Methylogaea oryzae]